MLTRNDLKRLSAVSGPCLTIFQPVRDNYSQLAKPYVRIAAALQEAERLLEEKGFDSAEREEMLRPLRKFALNTDWSSHRGSVLFFRAPDFTLAHFWPETLAPRVHLADEFLVLPLLPLLLSSRDFWLLGLSLKEMRLYRGSTEGIFEVPLPPGVPKTVAEDGAFDQPDHSMRSRSSAGRFVGNMKGVQFSTAPDLENKYLHDFYKAIDRGIRPILAADPHPLILAGIAREQAIYRTANSWEPLLTGGIHGNPDGLGVEMLHTKAAELMAAFSAREMDAKSRDLEEAANRGRMITDPVAILEAAQNGQVAELFIAPGPDPKPAHEDAVNWAALATIRNSGSIGLLGASRIGSGVAAILRYPLQEEAGERTAGQLTQS